VASVGHALCCFNERGVSNSSVWIANRNRTLPLRERDHIPIGMERFTPGEEEAHHDDDIPKGHVDGHKHDSPVVLGQSFPAGCTTCQQISSTQDCPWGVQTILDLCRSVLSRE
jgi:hypothetical protein